MYRLLGFALLAAPVCAQTPAVKIPGQGSVAATPELGSVAWQRDFDAALATSAAQHRPVFLLFQEIPGCSTCTGFGKDVLSHPLLAAAIEQCFVPVAVRNNVEGKEQQVLQRYDEPASNNPVVRFVDAAGNDLLPRKDGVWDAHGIAARMIAALEKAKVPVPGYLRIAHAESDPDTAKAVFAMHCFWEGEAVLGALDGVTATRSAFAGNAEVVEVTFRPAVLSEAALTERAQAKSCKTVTGGVLKQAPASDQQHALGGTPYGKLDLSPMQRTKVHSALTLGTDAKVWLTPAQVAALAKLQQEKR
ncbi:MAG TPA: VPGUxxT family thioredoxin-like (seleno)protein, type 2 [Planctomycetota bacterium]|nr:VPGUxxT family thioredoxin-like (seleno)protein, type 2 [Planctomycetota bacterium]